MQQKVLNGESAQQLGVILKRLGMDDLRLIIADVDPETDLDDIPGNTQNAKALELLRFCQNRGFSERLIAALKSNNIDLQNWQPVWEEKPLTTSGTSIESSVSSMPSQRTWLYAGIAAAALILVVTAIVIALNRTPKVTPNAPPDTPTADAVLAHVRVVFQRGPIGKAVLILKDLSNNQETELQKIGSDTGDASWAPDGKFIVASGGDDNQHDLVIYNLASAQVNRISQDGNDIDPDWSRSDNRIYFARGITAQNGDLYAIKPDGSGLTLLGLKGRQPTVSPDGSYIAYMQKGADDGFWHIRIVETGDMKEVCDLKANTTSPTPNLRMPNWLADSKGIVFNFADKNTEPQGIAYSDVKECRVKVSSIAGTEALPPLGRPSCGGNGLCVANHSTSTGGNLRLLQFDATSNTFTDKGMLTPKQPAGTADFAPDVYP